MNITPWDFSLSHARITGARHKENLQPCEDAVVLRSTEEYLFCGLADGQSGATRGAEGGRACLEAIADHVENIRLETLLHAPFPDELPCMLTRVFRKRLLTLAPPEDWKDLASTLLAVAVSRKTGDYLLLHLGDGCAICVAGDGEPAIFSPPEQGLSLHHTWLTTSDNAVSHLRLSFGSLRGRKRLVLLSDGAVCLCRGQNIPWRAKELLKNGTPEELHRFLERSVPADDATCILLDLAEQD